MLIYIHICVCIFYIFFIRIYKNKQKKSWRYHNMRDFKIGDVVFVLALPGKIWWDKEERAIKGKFDENTNFIVRENQLAMQDLQWNLYDMPEKIEEMLKKGFFATVRSISEGLVVLSHRAWQSDNYERLRVGQTLSTKIIKVDERYLTCEFHSFRIRVYVTEVTRTRMNNLKNFFNVGEYKRVKIIKKQYGFPYRIDGSCKQAWPQIEKVVNSYRIGEAIKVRVCERMNNNGVWIEITPAITGILNAPSWILDGLERGKYIDAEIEEVGILGIKCHFKEWVEEKEH